MDILNINFDLLFIGLAILAIIILGLVVYLNDRRNVINKSFLFFSLLTVAYGTVNYLAFQIKDPVITLWLLRLTIFFALWHAFSFFHLFYVFSSGIKLFPKTYTLVLLPIIALVSVFTLTRYMFSSIKDLGLIGQSAQANTQPGALVFIVLAVFLVGAGIFLLTKKTIHSIGLLKSQFKFISVGAYITFFLLITFNLILPAVFNYVRFVPYAPVFIFPFIFFTAIAIIKYKLFNVKVIATELITFSLWIFLLVRALTSSSTQEFIINGILFFITIGVGILLIKSVAREVYLREEIETMVQDVARAYEVEKRANEELANLDKTKNQFLLTIQHHLRTPLTSMMGYADLLLNGTFGEQNAKTMEVIGRFQVSTRGLIKMVNDFLDITQFQLGKDVVSMKPGIDIGAILNEIVIELSFKAESKKVALSFEKPTQPLLINADPQKLKAAIYNVIDNSIKYTQAGSVKVTTEKKDMVRILIKDTGIGISSAHLPNLFSRIFERGDQAKTFTTGSGIGLYLTGQIVKSHNGKVWAESEGEGKGSVFIIELPLSSAIPPVMPKTPTTPTNTKSQSEMPIKSL